MASNYTEKYQLNQWEASDKVVRTEFNEDNAKIEAALADLEDRKCNKTTLTALSSVVGLCNRELDDLKKRVTALENK